MEKLEKIAMLVWEKKLESRKAAFEIINIMQHNKAYFKLQKFDNEEFDDFIFQAFPTIVKILEKYDPSKASFTSFIYKTIGDSIKYYHRKKYVRLSAEESLNCMMDILNEEKKYRYAQNEGEIRIENSCIAQELQMKVNRSVKEKRSLLMNSIQTKYFHSNHCEKLEFLRKSACLILFLKSCAVADDAALKNTSIVTGISEDDLFKMLESLKSKMEKKLKRRQLVRKSRDAAFFYRRKYRSQFSNIEEGEENYDNICRRYDMQTERWVSHNEKLQRDFDISPTNKDISDLLNVSERKIAYILRVAKLKIEKLKLRDNL